MYSVRKIKFETSHILFLAIYVRPAICAGNRLRPQNAPLRPGRTGFTTLEKGTRRFKGVQLADAKNCHIYMHGKYVLIRSVGEHKH
jgi:hypothetical protein